MYARLTPDQQNNNGLGWISDTTTHSRSVMRRRTSHDVEKDRKIELEYKKKNIKDRLRIIETNGTKMIGPLPDDGQSITILSLKANTYIQLRSREDFNEYYRLKSEYLSLP